ncbi:MAG: DNA repair protein RadA [Oscillospiraceae bacterium]|jgi:DNA repair protein RadA/Sms|nr:DNA repair protein RadA [Oscillospiraceae bacterium]
MTKTKAAKVYYLCSDCGHEHLKWSGKCAGCGEWNTLAEFKERDEIKSSGSAEKLNLHTLSEINEDGGETRFGTGMSELDRVLGGGLVKGSLVLLSGDPGIGKSTLLLQICEFLGKNLKVLYISGEESERQIKLRADRLGIKSGNLLIAASTDCEAIVNAARESKADVLIIDSIQTITISGINSTAGSVTQVRECTSLLMRMAKTDETAVFVVGHVNKDGGVAGPKVLEHIVDAVLYFEGDKQLSYRILRAAKNRFGSTNEIGVFEMQTSGLAEVTNPSAMLLSGRPSGVGGISILCTMEGSRPILAEVQALVSKTGFGQPRRVANGFDYNRLCLILAVLEKRTGLLFGTYDVYINIIGGLKIEEPAADLAIALALFSGLTDLVVPEDVAVFGEIGLGGEIRNIRDIRERVRECKRMGFNKVIVPKAALKNLDKREDYGINITGAANLKQMFSALGSVPRI